VADPAHLTALCLLRYSYYYQIAHLGDWEDEAAFTGDSEEAPRYTPRPLRNLVPVDELESLTPVTSGLVTDLRGEDTPQLYVV
jgi:splicing factor 3B subunit 3